MNAKAKTAQEIFDKVATHLLKQQAKSRRLDAEDGNLFCAYRGQGESQGLSCAVGCLIPDEEYKTDMEGENIDSLMASGLLSAQLVTEFTHHHDLLVDLQRLHDNADVDDWKKSLERVALNYRLTFPIIAPKSE